MSFLLDSDTCSSIIRDVRPVQSRYFQNLADVRISVISITELEIWLLRSRTPRRYRPKFFNLTQAVRLIDVGEPIAHRAAMIHQNLRGRGQRIGLGDALIAATALESGLTLVTRTIPNFVNIPGLTVIDWSTP